MDEHSGAGVDYGERGRPDQTDAEADDICRDQEQGQASAAATSVTRHHRPKTTPKRIIVGIISTPFRSPIYAALISRRTRSTQFRLSVKGAPPAGGDDAGAVGLVSGVACVASNSSASCGGSGRKVVR
jgi:hypothetical protein